MDDILIIGSGPAAAAAALAALASGRRRIRVLDVGRRLETDREELIQRFQGIDPATWPPEVQAELATPARPEVEGELPQKRQFGSDFPFADAGQLGPHVAEPGGNRYPVSGAYGGFSNVWGAQILPFTRETLAQWPLADGALDPHYRAILGAIPYAAESDDYQESFPLFGEPDHLPPLAPGLAAVQTAYARRSSHVRARGVTLGAARLALQAPRCVTCGLCLTGCPHGLIYSASQTFDDLIRNDRVDYRSGVLVTRVGEDEQGPWVDVRDLASQRSERARADRIFVAGGGIGSTRLALASARPQVRQVILAESVQLVMPFLSRRPTPTLSAAGTFTLNQLNLLIEYGRSGLDLAHFHLYPYNPGFDEALPGAIAERPRLARAVLRRTTAGLGYLPSWHSPQVRLEVDIATPGELPGMRVSSIPRPGMRRVLGRVFTRLLAVAPALDLWPGIPALTVSGPAKSYHFGGGLAHVAGRPREGAMETDTLGRIAEWNRVHFIDGAVFPSVPATTFTLTVMANAHRITQTVLAG